MPPVRKRGADARNEAARKHALHAKSVERWSKEAERKACERALDALGLLCREYFGRQIDDKTER